MKASLVFALLFLTSFVVALQINGSYKQTACTCRNMCNNVNGFSDLYNVTNTDGKLNFAGAHRARGSINEQGKILIGAPTFCVGGFESKQINLNCIIDPGVTKCQITFTCTDGPCSQ